ncbi:MAG: hypothetical protein V4662_24625 [Verrucomicrobiota bacterium]
MPDAAAPFQLAVVTPGGKDGRQLFPHGAGKPDDPGHLPVNFHAYAACTQGAYWSGDAAMPDAQHVLLLIGSRMERAEALLLQLKEAGKTVVVTIKETGLPQVSAHFQKFENWSAFQRLCTGADGALATTFDTEPLYRAANPRLPVLFLPPPYPVEEWDLSSAGQSGVFIGTRQLFVTSRSHALALALVAPLAAELNQRVSVISGRASDLPPVKRLLNKVVDYSHDWHRRFAEGAPHVQVIARQMPALEYLRTMAAHRLVFQLDQSSVPGQVAGDALVCRVPCVGGNGTAERLVFPDLCGHGRTTGELLDLTRRLLTDTGFHQEMVRRAVALAREKMCFSTARCGLADFFGSLGH